MKAAYNGFKLSSDLIIFMNTIFLIFFFMSGLFLIFTQGIGRNMPACIFADLAILICIIEAIRPDGFFSGVKAGRNVLHALIYSCISWFLIMLQYYVLSLTAGIPPWNYIAIAAAETIVFGLVAGIAFTFVLMIAGIIIDWTLSSDKRSVIVLVLLLVAVAAAICLGLYTTVGIKSNF